MGRHNSPAARHEVREGVDFDLVTRELAQLNMFRRSDADQLVIFERRGTLLQRRNWHTELSLADIDEMFIQVLIQLRKLGIGFGFVSDQQGMEVDKVNCKSASVLIKMLDGILGACKAKPDFWLAWPSSAKEKSSQPSEDPRSPDLSAMITRIITHYGVEISSCVFVGTSPLGLAAASRLGMQTLEFHPIDGGRHLHTEIGTRSCQGLISDTAEMIALQIEARSRQGTGCGLRLMPQVQGTWR